MLESDSWQLYHILQYNTETHSQNIIETHKKSLKHIFMNLLHRIKILSSRRKVEVLWTISTVTNILKIVLSYTYFVKDIWKILTYIETYIVYQMIKVVPSLDCDILKGIQMTYTFWNETTTTWHEKFGQKKLYGDNEHDVSYSFIDWKIRKHNCPRKSNFGAHTHLGVRLWPLLSKVWNHSRGISRNSNHSNVIIAYQKQDEAHVSHST